MPSPLSLTIVSTAINIPGPVACALLRDLGATVIKIEPPGGDPLRVVSPQWYAELTSGIEVKTADLKTPAGRDVLEGALAAADLLMTASRPAALERLGLDWESLHARFPRLCVVSIVGYAAPRQDVAGHDLTYQAEEGLVTPPALPRTFISDLGGAQRAVIEALRLVIERDGTGVGGRAEVSLSESARFFAAPVRHGLTTSGAPLGGALPTYNMYAAGEGFVAVAALEPHFAERLQREMQVDISNHEALARAFLGRTADEWQRWAEARDLPIVAVRASNRHLNW